MTIIDRLVKTIEARGLAIKPGEQPDTLVLQGPAEEKTPEVLEALKAFKPELLRRFGQSHQQQVAVVRETASEAGLVEDDRQPRGTMRGLSLYMVRDADA